MTKYEELREFENDHDHWMFSDRTIFFEIQLVELKKMPKEEHQSNFPSSLL
jgi:hypothetical protein